MLNGSGNGVAFRGARFSDAPSSLLPVASDISGNAAGYAANCGTCPGITPGHGRDACARTGTDGRAAHRSLLLRRHIRAPENSSYRRDQQNESFSCHGPPSLAGFLQPRYDHSNQIVSMTGRCNLSGFAAYRWSRLSRTLSSL
jgi:hypothetical protein